MMASKREQVLQALFDRLSGIAGPKVLRNEVLPERIPAGGVVILRDGDPGEPDVLLSPPEYVYEHRADVEVVVDGATPAARDGTFDSIMTAIGAAIAGDRTLGGLCDFHEAVAPEPIDLAVDGAPGLKAAVVPIILHYGSADPLS
jgi:hypothetical protein